MGLIKATINAMRGTLADQYKEFMVCDEMSSNVLVRKGQVLRTQDNTNAGRDNVLTDGTGIVVNEGQCALIVENGKIIDFCNEPDTYIYRNDLAPSMLTGGWEGLKKSFKTLSDRIQTGGQRFSDQRVYYINTKELMGNKFGIGQVPFRDNEFRFTIKISAYGNYSYRITDPLMFYTNVTGNIDKEFTRDKIDSQFKSEVQSSLQVALNRVSSEIPTYDQLPSYARVIGKAVNEELTEDWVNLRGISVVSFAIAQVTPDAESAKKIEEFQSTRVYTDASMLGARLGTAQAEAMVEAAKNKSGAMTGFMGMGMAQNVGGGLNPADLLSMGQQQRERENEERKEDELKRQKELEEKEASNAMNNTWNCNCGIVNAGKFCIECGEKKPNNNWICQCGVENKGKFCSECGKKGEIELDSNCEACGFTGESSFKFCPECGAENK